MKIEEIAKNEGIWKYVNMEGSDIALKSSILMRRNIKGYNFSNKLSKTKKNKLANSLTNSIVNGDNYFEYTSFDIESLNSLERKIFEERNILDKNSEAKYIVLSNDERSYFLLGDEDHIALVMNNPGYMFDDIYDLGDQILLDLGKNFKYAFLPEFGYLTSNPKNAGPGFKMILTCHLIGTVTLGTLNDLISGLKRKGFIVKSSWINDYYSIYNNTSLGLTENELYSKSIKIFKEIVNVEKKAREDIFKLNKEAIEDRVWRSVGILTTARMVSRFEALDLLSKISFGISLGIIKNPTIKEINSLLYFIQDAHLLKRFNLSDEYNNKGNYDVIIDEIRANLLRNYLKEVA